MLTGFHLRVAQALLDAGEKHGFAIGGGYALAAHGIGDRLSEDIDAYGARFARRTTPWNGTSSPQRRARTLPSRSRTVSRTCFGGSRSPINVRARPC